MKLDAKFNSKISLDCPFKILIFLTTQGLLIIIDAKNIKYKKK